MPKGQALKEPLRKPLRSVQPLDERESQMKVTVWSTPNCVQCAQTKKQFDKLGIRYDEMALDQHPDKLEEFKSRGLLQAPIVTTDTKTWSGFRLDKIQSLASHLAEPVALTETEIERKRIIAIIEAHGTTASVSDLIAEINK